MSHPVIEELRPLPRDPGRVRVIVQGESIGTLRRETVDELGLRQGRTLSVALATRVREVIAAEGCRLDAMRRLGRRDMTQALLAARLAPTWGESLAERVAADLAREGWLNDGDYAQRRAQALQRRAPIASEAMQARLEAEGVPAPIARRAASAAHDPARLQQQIRAWKRAGRNAASMARALGRQGFDFDTIAAALHRAGLECPAVD
jgi:SOS response regulatory protein OraA/RecX